MVQTPLHASAPARLHGVVLIVFETHTDEQFPDLSTNRQPRTPYDDNQAAWSWRPSPNDHTATDKSCSSTMDSSECPTSKKAASHFSGWTDSQTGRSDRATDHGTLLSSDAMDCTFQALPLLCSRYVKGLACLVQRYESSDARIPPARTDLSQAVLATRSQPDPNQHLRSALPRAGTRPTDLRHLW